MIFTALIVKFLSAGAVAQAATGATVAVVAFTGVGAVGALPDPVQDTFATVVSEITPIEPPTSGEATEETTEELVPEETVAEEAETPEEVAEVPADVEELEAQVKAWALEGPADGQSISAWASEGSKADIKSWLRARGMNYGNVVSAWASGKGFSDEELVALGADLDESTEVPTEVVTEPDADVVVEDVPETEQAEVATTEDRGSRSTGKANGNGNGKSKGNGKN